MTNKFGTIIHFLWVYWESPPTYDICNTQYEKMQNETNSTNAGNKLKDPPKAAHLNNQSSIIHTHGPVRAGNQLKGPISPTTHQRITQTTQISPPTFTQKYPKNANFSQLFSTFSCKTNPILLPIPLVPHRPTGHDSAELVEVERRKNAKQTQFTKHPNKRNFIYNKGLRKCTPPQTPAKQTQFHPHTRTRRLILMRIAIPKHSSTTVAGSGVVISSWAFSSVPISAK